MAYGTIGTLIHGTMRNEDLLTAFADEIERLDASGKHAAYINDARDWRGRGYEFANDVLERLFDALDEYAPPYCYFGAHAGDGSDYGFWPDVESLEADARWMGTGVTKIEAGDSYPDGSYYVMEVNDRGDVTLYGPDRKEIWSVV